jgi:hypothetical protein
MISVSENFLVESVFFDKVRFVPSLDKVFVSTLAILFNVKDARVFDWQHICYIWWTVGISMGTHCFSSRRLVPLFVWSIQGLLKKNEKKLDRSFNFRFCYTDDVLSLNNSRFDDTLIVSIPLSLKYRIRQVQIQMQQPSTKEILPGTTSSRISLQLRYIYICIYSIAVAPGMLLHINGSKWTRIWSTCHKHFPVLSSFIACHRVCN